MTVTDTGRLAVLEAYYDAAPRPQATTEEVGPFTVFVKTEPAGWPYYARPRLGSDRAISAADVRAVRAHQRQLDVPETIEWVHETTPSLRAACLETGMTVHECPLLVLPEASTAVEQATAVPPVEGSVAVLGPESPELTAVAGAVNAGFAGTDTVQPREGRRQPSLMRQGLLAVVAAYDGHGDVVGGGTHSPRGRTTELTGIAVIPRARRHGLGFAITRALVEDAKARGIETIFLSAQDDAVARIYQRAGFVRVGTACVAEAR